MSLILSCLRSNSLRPAAAKAMVSSSSANFFWSSPEVSKPPPPPETTSPSTSTAAADDVETITTTDVVKLVAEAHSLSQAESRRVVNTIFDAIKDGVAEKKAVKISGFGSFFSATSKATKGRNPRTGEAIDIPEKERVKFRPYNEFKSSVSKA